MFLDRKPTLKIRALVDTLTALVADTDGRLDVEDLCRRTEGTVLALLPDLTVRRYTPQQQQLLDQVVKLRFEARTKFSSDSPICTFLDEVDTRSRAIIEYFDALCFLAVDIQTANRWMPAKIE